MKPQAKKIFFYFGIALLGLVVVFLVVRIMLNLGSIANTLAAVLGALRPILMGCILAYLLYPLARFSEQFLLYHKVRQKTARSLSTMFTTLVLLLFIVLLIYFIIPQLFINLPDLVQRLPSMIQSSSQELANWLEAHGQQADLVQKATDTITEKFTLWLSNGSLSTILDLAGRVAQAAVSVFHFLIGIIVMVYVLVSRDQFVGQAKKLLFALSRNRSFCDRLLHHLRAINRIFSNFVSGKLLDSLIIGLICAVCLSIMQMPYTALISIIVGITNIIPVFGPFIGAIPSIFLLLLTDPYKALIFAAFVVILQQVDGNIIGPKILGNSTGLSAFWVLFSLLFFNYFMGFLGMLLGVPLFASFYYLAREFVNSRLRRKSLPINTLEYVNAAGFDDDGALTHVEPKGIEFNPLFRGENSLFNQLRRMLKEKSIHPHSKKKTDHSSDEPDDKP